MGCALRQPSGLREGLTRELTSQIESADGVRARDGRPARIEARLAERRVVRVRIHGGAQSTQGFLAVKLFEWNGRTHFRDIASAAGPRLD